MFSQNYVEIDVLVHDFVGERLFLETIDFFQKYGPDAIIR
jgi:hypothetical protein